MRLSQYVALLKTAKNSAYSQVTNTYHRLQRVGEFVGQVRTYQPTSDDGETKPSEVQIVQTRTPELLREAAKVWGEQFDLQAAVDFGNAAAKGNVVVGGKTLIADAPVPYLLFVEKQLKDWIAILRKLPLLDPSKDWFWDADREDWFTEPVKTAATKKMTKFNVVVPVHDKHPAQVKETVEDVTVGYWSTVYRSGAMHRKDIRKLLEKAEEFAAAVKVAREEANSAEVGSKRGTGKVVFDYLLSD
jgi:hypothetical protein